MFSYCPYCGTPLAEQVRHGALRPTCARCGFVQFHDPKVAVVALVTYGNAALLIRRGVPPGKGLWALPGGYMDAGEMPAAALARELAEEVGLAVEVGALLAILPLMLGAVQRGIVLAFAAQLAPGGAAEPVAGDDVTEARWFAAGALPAELAFDSTHDLLAQWSAAQPKSNSVQNEAKG